MNVASALTRLRHWRSRQAGTTGIIVSRKVMRERSAYVVLLDLHFEYEGRSHHTQARVAEFPDASQAQSALAEWPIGSFRRLTFSPGCPESGRLA